MRTRASVDTDAASIASRIVSNWSVQAIDVFSDLYRICLTDAGTSPTSDAEAVITNPYDGRFQETSTRR